MREDNGRTLRLIAELLPYREDAVISALQSFVAQAESVSSLAVIGFLDHLADDFLLGAGDAVRDLPGFESRRRWRAAS